MHVSPTVEGEGMCEGQHGDVPAVVVNVGIHKGQVAAVVNDGLHLGHVRVDRLVVDGAQQHTPAIHEAIPPEIQDGFVVIRALTRRLNLVSFVTACHVLSFACTCTRKQPEKCSSDIAKKAFFFFFF